MSSRPGKTYEMQWDCQFCGTTKLLGKTHRFCPNCGAPQNPDARYYPADNEKVAVEDHIYVGADKTCANCSQLNSGDAEFCQQCGAPLTDAAQAKVVDRQTRGLSGLFESSGSRDVVKEQFDAEMQRVGVDKKKNAGTNWKLYAIIGVIAVVIIGVIAALTITKEATIVASAHEWSREINIDQYNNFSEQAWWDNQPIGDNVIRGLCTDRQRSTNRIPDGQECTTHRVDQGDGTYREEESCQTKYREEPVYDDWCTFTGRRWESERTVKTEGKDTEPAPYWGDPALNCAGQNSIGCERESGRNEIYNVVFKGDKSAEYRCPFPQPKWQEIAIESVWTVNVRIVDQNAADCNSLKQK